MPMRRSLIRHFWGAGAAQWLTAISCDRPQKLPGGTWTRENAGERGRVLSSSVCSSVWLMGEKSTGWGEEGAATSSCLHSDKAMISSAISACSRLKGTDWGLTTPQLLHQVFSVAPGMWVSLHESTFHQEKENTLLWPLVMFIWKCSCG